MDKFNKDLLNHGIIAIVLSAGLCFSSNISARSNDKSDLNSDQIVNYDDLVLFSTKYLRQNSETIDWCQFYDDTTAGNEFEGNSTKYYKKNFTQLLSFINNYYACDAEPYLLDLENEPKSLYRMSEYSNSDGDYFITDPRLGSVFIYDNNMVLKGELKGLSNPLGVAVNSQGNIFVGNSENGRVEIYDSTNGDYLGALGEGLLKMPNAITIDNAGYIYVTDSRLNTVVVFDTYYNLVAGIGRPGDAESELFFPVDAEIIGTEIFVADQGHARIQVYNLTGNWVRNITFDGTPGQNCSWFTGVCAIPGVPEFKRIQALETDLSGRLHVLDKLAATTHIFNSQTGEYISSYGEYGDELGQFKIPTDVHVSTANTAMITTVAGEIEFFTIE